MKYTIVLLTSFFLLTGCKHWLGDLPDTKPVQVPELPAELSKKAERLPELTDNTMGGVVLDAAATDKKYNAVAHQTNSLIKYYNCVKASVNEKKDLKQCLQD